MKTKDLHYNLFIRQEGKDFIAYVPTLGISDFGKTLEEAKMNVQQAIQIHIEGLIKTRTEVPSPDTSEFYISQTAVSIPASS